MVRGKFLQTILRFLKFNDFFNAEPRKAFCRFSDSTLKEGGKFFNG